MPLFNNVLAGAAGQGGAADYVIPKSLRFNSGDSADLRRTPSSAGNRSIWTWSGWIKRANLGGSQVLFSSFSGSASDYIILSNDGITVDLNSSNSGSKVTSRKFRDCSAWYHILVAADYTSSTANDRIKIYINGVLETDFSTNTAPSQNYQGLINNTHVHAIGAVASSSYFDGYLADVHFIDGQALVPTDFGEFSDTGVWNPIQYTGNFNASGSGTMYSGMLTSSSGFLSGYGAERAFDGSLNTGAWNTNNYDNYIEFTPTTPINFTNGVQVHCYAANGYNITNYYSVDLDGNGLGSETTFVGGGTNFNGFAWIDVATGSGTLHKLRIRLTRQGSGSGVEIRAIAINGSGSSSNYLVDGTPAGVNGFHLDFDPEAAGVDYASNITGTLVNPANMFDGNTSTKVNGAANTDGIATFPTAIENVTKVEVAFASNNSGGHYLLLNGNQVNTNGNGLTSYKDVTSYLGGSTFSSIGIRGGTGGAPEVTAIRVTADGKTFDLISYLAPGIDASGDGNHWTANNISLQGAANYSTGTFSVQGGGSMLYEAQAFNGSTSNGAIQNGIGSGTNEHTWTPSSPITGVTSLRIYMRRSDASGGDSNFQYKINTGSYVNSGIAQNGSGWVTPSSVPSTLSSISLKSVISNNSSGLGINAIEVNGTILENVDGSGYDILSDTPTDNFCTLNPLSVPSQNPTLSNGNLTMTSTGVNQGRNGTLAVPFSGKWYYEVTIGSGGSGVWQMGISDSINQNNSDGARLIILSDARKQILQNGSATFASYGSGWSTGDVMACAFDADNNSLTFYKNGTSMGVAYSNVSDYLGDSITPYFQLEHSGRNFTINFGQLPWVHTPPANHNGWSTGALPNPAINNPSKHFTTTLYSGNGSSQTITTGMPNDLVWIKRRNSSGSHSIHDTVRGATKRIRSESSDAETTETTAVTAIGSDGFTLGSGGTANGNNDSFVSWTWNMGSTTQTISAGGLNSSLYNQSAIWTNDLTTNSGTSWFGGAAANVFDGSTSTFVQGAVGYDVTFTPTTGIAVANSMRIWADSGSGFGVGNGPYTITYNGTQVYSGSMWSSPYTITAAAGTTFSSLVIAPSGNEAMRLFAVEIDGKLLINSNVSVANVPSIGADVRANQDAGHSIVSYSGTDSAGGFPHGLLQAPELVLIKARNRADGWPSYHSALGANNYIDLNGNGASGSSSGIYNAVPDSNVVYLHEDHAVNGPYNYIAYCFHSVPSFSKVGVYTGNGQSGGAGPYIPLDFRARFILLKNIDLAGSNWFIFDAARNTYNAVEENLKPNSNAQEETDSSGTLDIVSNGFQVRSNGSHPNGNGNKIIYYAVAESPSKYARAR